MKKTICWLMLILLLLGGCANKGQSREKKVGISAVLEAEPIVNIPVVEWYYEFMAILSAAVIDGKSNKNVSPVSVYLALALAAEGAQGQTQAEMLAVLGEDTIEDLRKRAEQLLADLDISIMGSELVLANSIWMGEQDKTVTFQEAYIDILKNSYGAEARSVRFGEPAAAKKIAAWIMEKTREKIKVSDDAMSFDADTLAVLLNTIYLKDGWRETFDKERTEEGIFYGPDGQEQKVNYMRRKEYDGTIVRGNGYMRFCKSLSAVGNMIFVLPDEGVSLESLLGSPEKIDELLHGGEKSLAEVDVKMPKFKFQDRTDLERTLISLGVRTCFTGEADFSAMTDVPAHVSRVLQESFIGVDENGVEAAAYTMIALAKGAAMPLEREKVDFHLTRPFLYAIESRDGTVLFIGTVTAPDKA